MELSEKDALKSWGFSYATNQVTEWQYHYSTDVYKRQVDAVHALVGGEIRQEPALDDLPRKIKMCIRDSSGVLLNPGAYNEMPDPSTV